MGRFIRWLDVALVAFDPESQDLGVDAYLETVGFLPDAVTFQIEFADFVHLHRGITDDLLDDKYHNLKGLEHRGRWTPRQFRDLVSVLHRKSVRSFLMLVSWTNLPDYGARCAWFDDHQELIQTNIWGKRGYGDSINHFKRFASGEYYEDFFAARTVAVLDDYGFDGLVLADGYLGLRGPSETLEVTDYSDDMIAQFIEFLGSRNVPVARDFLLDCGTAMPEKARYIQSRLSAEWIAFYARRHEEFFAKVLGAVAPHGKEVVILDAWAKASTDAYYDHGVDYRRLADLGLKTLIIQAHAAVKELRFHEGWSVSEHTQVVHIAMLRAQIPELTLLVSTVTIGNSETWFALRETPAVVERELASYLTLTTWDAQGTPRRCIDGTWVLEGFGLARSEWDWLAARWEEGIAVAPDQITGLSLIWSDHAFDWCRRRGERYCLTRHLYHLIHAGLPVHSSVRLDALPEQGHGVVFEPNGLSEGELRALKRLVQNPGRLALVIGDLPEGLFTDLFGFPLESLLSGEKADTSRDVMCRKVFAEGTRNCDRYPTAAEWLGRRDDVSVARIDCGVRSGISLFAAELSDRSRFLLLQDHGRQWIWANRADVPAVLLDLLVRKVGELMHDEVVAESSHYTIGRREEVRLHVENVDTLLYRQIAVRLPFPAPRSIVRNRHVQRESVSGNGFTVVVPPQGVAVVCIPRSAD